MVFKVMGTKRKVARNPPILRDRNHAVVPGCGDVREQLSVLAPARSAYLELANFLLHVLRHFRVVCGVLLQVLEKEFQFFQGLLKIFHSVRVAICAYRPLFVFLRN